MREGAENIFCGLDWRKASSFFPGKGRVVRNKAVLGLPELSLLQLGKWRLSHQALAGDMVQWHSGSHSEDSREGNIPPPGPDGA